MKQKEKLRQSKLMRNKKSFIFLLILCLGVGFAFLSSQLTITGNTSVSGNKWSVYFNNVQVTEGSVDATVIPTTTGNTTTSVEYTVNLDKPGDFYEFTVDAVNDGTIDAMIESITTPNIDSRVLQYVNYSATYLDGTELAQNDVLKKNKTATYKVRVEFKKNISANDLSEEDINLTLMFGVNYVQSNIKPKKFIELVKDSALDDSNIDFTNISSETNGKGLYVRTGTEEDDYPIYYYRGNVSNNNAKFAGFCWKIVRTTETGGTKLIYNGVPNALGECSRKTGVATQLESKVYFNENRNSPAYSGYMYGTVYQVQEATVNTSHVYGNTFTYGNGKYTLSETHNGIDSMHHYTCFSSNTSCELINYVFNVSDSEYYITLSNGKSVEDAFRDMNINTTNSTVKTAIDNWFNNTFKTYFTNSSKDYNDYLEDTVWCNDRSMNTTEVAVPAGQVSAVDNGWNPNGGSTSNYLYYSAYGRMKSGNPSLVCSNKNDSFTVTESASGNGALTYPVGLLTVDEIMLAGGTYDQNLDFYLCTKQSWWSLSPSMFQNSSSTFGEGYSLGNYGSSQIGVRPSISIKSSIKILDGGDGTAQSPYEFVVE